LGGGAHFLFIVVSLVHHHHHHSFVIYLQSKHIGNIVVIATSIVGHKTSLPVVQLTCWLPNYTTMYSFVASRYWGGHWLGPSLPIPIP